MNIEQEISGILRESRRITIDNLSHPAYWLKISTEKKGASVNVLYLGPLPEERLQDAQGNQVTFRLIELESGAIVHVLEMVRHFWSTPSPYASREEVAQATKYFSQGRYRL